MGSQISSCRSVVDGAQERVMSVVCCRSRDKGSKNSNGHKYGALGLGKYDESDDEDMRGILYNNNLLLDDDDDEEE